jgi:hypothetical protein
MGTRLRPIWPIVALPFASGCVVAAGTSRDSSGSSVLLLLVPLALVFGMAMLLRRAMGGGRRRTARQDTSSTANVQVLRAELSVLADDVIRLEPQVALKDAARDDFETATHRYRVAQAALDYVKEPADLVRVQRVVDEATWSMSRARAIVEGRRPPSPPPSLRRPGPQGEPAVDVDERQRPVYVDSPAPFRSGWFAAGGGLLGGLLLGGFGSVWVEDDDAGDVVKDPSGTDDTDGW